MTSTTFFIIFIPILAIILLAVNLILAPHNPYQEKDSPFECGFHSFSGQNRTQFSISFFIFALLFLLFDLEIVLIYPYSVSGYNNGIYGLAIMIVFFLVLTGGFVFELGKNALSIESRQTSTYENEDIPESHAFISFLWESILINSRVSGFSYFDALIIRFVLWFYKNETQYKIFLIQVVYGSIVALYYALDHFDITITFGYFDIILLSLNFLYEMDLWFCKVYEEEFNFDGIIDESDNDHIFPINIDDMLLFDESDNDDISSTDESDDAGPSSDDHGPSSSSPEGSSSGSTVNNQDNGGFRRDPLDYPPQTQRFFEEFPKTKSCDHKSSAIFPEFRSDNGQFALEEVPCVGDKEPKHSMGNDQLDEYSICDNCGGYICKYCREEPVSSSSSEVSSSPDESKDNDQNSESKEDDNQNNKPSERGNKRLHDDSDDSYSNKKPRNK